MIRFLDIKKITDSFQPGIGEAIARVVASGSFVRGREVQCFEAAYASFIGTKYCVGVGNGFDALQLILRAWIASGVMQEGDEVIVPANTYIASILAITENRLVPVLVDPDPATYIIKPAAVASRITSRTRAIMIVHLYGRNAMDAELNDLVTRKGLKVIEDNAQAIGAYFGKQRTGALGDAAAHSFFPTKNLGALGDGGAVTTDDPELATMVQTLGNYGAHTRGLNDVQGVNSRLDELQAAVLNVKLPRIDQDNCRRAQAAQFYLENIRHPMIILPQTPVVSDGRLENVWHLFVVRCSQRDALRQHLLRHDIEALIHYPVPPHRQRAYKALNHLSFPVAEQLHREVLSLPLSPVMEQEALAQVVEAVNGFGV